MTKIRFYAENTETDEPIEEWDTDAIPRVGDLVIFHMTIAPRTVVAVRFREFGKLVDVEVSW